MSDIPLLGILAGDSISRLRFTAAGEYINGYWTEPNSNVVQTDDIPASVQTPNRLGSSRIQERAEGTRIQDWRVVYCSPNTLRELDEVAGIKEDHIIYDGLEYVVKDINHRTGQVLAHDQAFVKRVDAGESWYKPTEVSEITDV